MIAVVPDTNVLWGELSSKRPNASWQHLLGLSASGEVRVVLSEIVQWELVNQLREDLDKRISTHRTATERLVSAGLSPPCYGEGPSIAAEIVAEASERLRQEVLWSNGEIRSVPDVGHAELVRRSLERRPPFDQSDRGYRDALLWHTVLDLLREGTSVVLATNDARAFSSGKDECQLHPLLVHEAEALNNGDCRVRLARSLGEAVEILTAYSDESRATAQRALADDDFVAELLERFVEQAAGAVVEQHALHAQGWPCDLIGVRITDVLDFGGLNVVSAVRESPAALRVELSLRVRAGLDARLLDALEYWEAADLIDTGYINDYGVGLTDGLHQMMLTRDVELFGEVSVKSGNGPGSDRLQLREIRIARCGAAPGQLRLEIDPLPFS